MINKAKYVHINIISHDWERLAKFYEKVFGCIRLYPERDLKGKWIEQGTGIPGAEITGAHLRLPGHTEDGPTLEIFQYNISRDAEGRYVNKPGFSHIAFRVDSVEEALQEVITAGGGVVGEVVTKQIPDIGLLTFVYAKDPDGNIIELQSWD